MCQSLDRKTLGVHEFAKIVDLAQISAMVPMTNAWPERSACAVKCINREQEDR